MSDDDKKMAKVSTYVSKHYETKLRELRIDTKHTLAKLVSIAIDNEFQRENPFEFSETLPDDNYIEMAYVGEAGKILDYITTLHGTGMDLAYLLLVRHDIGIEDKEVFLLAFRELVEKKMIESFKPSNKWGKEQPEGHVRYRAIGTGPKDVKRVKRTSTEFQTYQRLKKKFKKEGEE